MSTVRKNIETEGSVILGGSAKVPQCLKSPTGQHDWQKFAGSAKGNMVRVCEHCKLARFDEKDNGFQYYGPKHRVA
jgi:hypothetical protein